MDRRIVHMLVDQETWVYDLKARLAWRYSWHRFSMDLWKASALVLALQFYHPQETRAPDRLQQCWEFFVRNRCKASTWPDFRHFCASMRMTPVDRFTCQRRV